MKRPIFEYLHTTSLLPACLFTVMTWTPSAFAQSEILTRQALQSVENTEFTLLRIVLPPGAGNDDPAMGHRHPGDTIVYVESGTVTNQMNDEEPKEYKAGEFWVEGPEELHAVFRNNDPEEEASVIVFMTVKPDEPLTHR